MRKNGKIPGGHGKLDWKFKGVTFKKFDILKGGGGKIYFWKSPLLMEYHGVSHLLYICPRYK